MTVGSASFLSRRLRLSQLLVLEEVLASGSILRTGQALGLSQPAVTRIVRELEETFGLPLLVRTNRGVQPTEFGRRMGRRAKRVLSELRDMSEEAQAYVAGHAGHVRVGMLAAASASALPQAIHRLKQEAPGVLVSIRVGELSALMDALALGELDLVVARLPDDERWRRTHPTLVMDELYRDALCVVAGSAHPLAGSRRMALRRLQDLPWIVPGPESPFRARLQDLFASQGMSWPSNAIESLSILTNLSLFTDAHTVGFMSQGGAQPFVNAGMLCVLPVRLDVDFGAIGVFHRADTDAGPAARALHGLLRTVTAAANLAGT